MKKLAVINNRGKYELSDPSEFDDVNSAFIGYICIDELKETPRHEKPTPYVLLRLDTLEKINFMSIADAINTLIELSKMGLASQIFQFDESRKRYI